MANNQWVSVDDRLPDGDWVLVQFDSGAYAVARYQKILGVWGTSNRSPEMGAVAYWRPLPPGPDEDEASLPPAPEVHSAYNTGDGWALFDENEEPVEWPDNWPHWVSHSQMRAAGIEVV